MDLFVFLLFALPSSFFDIKKFRLPLIFVCIGIVVLFFLRIFCLHFSVINTFLAVFSSVLILFLTRILSANGLGIGDIFFGTFTAIFCGFYENLISLTVSALVGVLFYLIAFLLKKIKKQKITIFAIPFVPFLTIGALLSRFVL